MAVSPVKPTKIIQQSLPTQNGPDRLLLSLVLRGGVGLSVAFIVVGLAAFLVTGQTGYVENLNAGVNGFTTFHDTAASGSAIYFPTSPVEIWQGVVAFKPFAFIMLGLLVLIATPILNLFLAGWGFVQQKNWAFSLICGVVLAILAVSFLLGTAGG
jgi:uncharacterized membrane protein